MKRSKFIKTLGVATAGAIAAPYILPSGRLFAASGNQLADHVVFVLFAGGVRQQESVLQRYLADSQGLAWDGNIMYNMLNGGAPQNKIVYGVDQVNNQNVPIPTILNQSLQSQGTLFPEMRCSTSGHFAGLNELLQGTVATTQGLKQKPANPTIFEYVRKHMGIPASKTWFVGGGIGNSIPLLNYSEHPDYGSKYGANFFAPLVTFGDDGQEYLADAKVYHPQDQLSPMYQMKYFLDNSFENASNGLPNLGNTEEEKQDIKAFMKEMFTKTQNGTIAKPPVSDNSDLATVGYACEVLKWFKPTVTVVNLGNVDGCHADFTGYLKALHRADHAVGHLWNFIQTQIPEMAGNTVLMAAPECGRNLNHNPIKDYNDWYAFDHSDANSLRVFGMMAGPGIQSNLVVGSENNPVGEIHDCVLTVGEILGIKPEIQSANLVSASSMSLFDRI